jgi:formamidopyrimidine-DNA glycosylase
MPELPEVETFRRRFLYGDDHSPSLVGRRILGSNLLWGKTLETPSPDEFRGRIRGQAILTVDRRAKYLLFRLTADTLAIHLRMSGDLLVESQSDPIAKHHRLLLDFDDHSRLAFNDTRKFGRVWLMADPAAILGHLGPEPLGTEFTPTSFFEKLQSRARQIKPLLLDQNFLAGMGNIYTDEALFLAKIHPQTRAAEISVEQAERLWGTIRQVLQTGIERHGSSIDWIYRGGEFQNEFQVYQRTGAACYECGKMIKRLIVGQRSTHICPQCQPKNEDSMR